jgi:hypothetical protein
VRTAPVITAQFGRRTVENDNAAIFRKIDGTDSIKLVGRFAIDAANAEHGIRRDAPLLAILPCRPGILHDANAGAVAHGVRDTTGITVGARGQ